MTEGQPTPNPPTDAEIRLQALEEKFSDLVKENTDLKRRLADSELEKAMKEPTPSPEPEPEPEDSLDALVEESVARIRQKESAKE